MRICLTWFVLVACGSKASNGDVDAGFDAGPCPDQHGAYSVALSGAGCGDTATAGQCVTQSGCHITFGSTPATALNGFASLGMDGSFTMAAITEGTGNRTGCVGTWDATTATLTVDCGGVGSSQSCRATLTRTATTCN
jgi:hypothetical protein